MSQFRFKRFNIRQDLTAMKVGTDGVLLGAWANAGGRKILDIGSGTGLIGLMMAQRFSLAEIDAIDIDEHAYEQTCYNFIQSPFGERLQCFHAGLSEWINFSNKRYDHLICNPPYFYKGFEVKDLKRKRARDAGFLPQELLVSAFLKLGVETALMSVIMPVEEGEKFITLATQSGIYCTRKTIVFSKASKPPIRVILEFKKVFADTLEAELIIENEGQHQYTEAYKQLTADFYLMF